MKALSEELPVEVSASARSDNVRQSWFILAFVCVPVFLGSVDLTVVSAFFPKLLNELGLTLDSEGLADVTWVLTSYLLAYSISLFAMGRVSDLIGRRKALVICLSLYVLGSGLVAYYQVPAGLLGWVYQTLGFTFEIPVINMHMVVIARIIAASGAGAITSVAIALIGDVFPVKARAIPLGIVVATDTIGWLVGAAWGGLVIQFLPWQAIFLINMPLAVIALFLVLRTLSGVPAVRAEGRFDFIGFVMLVGMLTSLNIGLGNLRAGETGLNINSVLPTFFLALLFFGGFVFRQLRARFPIIALGMFRHRHASMAAALNLLVGYCMFISFVSIPLFVNVKNLDQIGFATAISPIRDNALKDASWQTGVLMASFTFPLALASVAGGWLIHRFGTARTTLLGLMLAVVGFGLMWRFLSLDMSDALVAGMMVITGVGIGLTFTPVILTILGVVSEEQRGMASAIILGVRMVGMTISTSTLSVYGTQRVVDLVVSIEQGRFFFPLVEPADYAAVFSTTYLNSSIQMLGEMAFIGLVLCCAALIPAFMLPRKLTVERR